MQGNLKLYSHILDRSHHTSYWIKFYNAKNSFPISAITFYHREKITQSLLHSSITSYHQEKTKTLASSPIKHQLLLTQSLCLSQKLPKTQMKGCLAMPEVTAHLATMEIEEQPRMTAMQQAFEEWQCHDITHWHNSSTIVCDIQLKVILNLHFNFFCNYYTFNKELNSIASG